LQPDHKIQIWSHDLIWGKVFWVFKNGQKKCPKTDFPKKSSPNFSTLPTYEGTEISRKI